MRKIRLAMAVIFTGFLMLIAYLFVSDPTPDNFKVDQELFPYQSRYLELQNGARIHYIDEGKGPTLLLLHGNPTWSFLYRDIIDELKNEFRLIAPDYPGFGLSSAPQNYGFTAAEQSRAMSEFVQKLDLQNIGIMVQDWGGPIGFGLALLNPERVSRFIIGNTWAWPLERKGQKTFSSLMGGWPGQFAAWCCNGIVRFFMARGVVTALDDKVLAMYTAPFANRDKRKQTHIFPDQLSAAKPFLSKIYQHINSLSDRSVLIVWGTQDFAFQKPERIHFESIFPNHKTVLLENAGHFIQEDAPKEIADAIRMFYQNR